MDNQKQYAKGTQDQKNCQWMLQILEDLCPLILVDLCRVAGTTTCAWTPSSSPPPAPAICLSTIRAVKTMLHHSPHPLASSNQKKPSLFFPTKMLQSQRKILRRELIPTNWTI